MFVSRTSRCSVLLLGLVAGALLIGGLGCDRSTASGGKDIPASSFRADPSKMTEADKERMKAAMGGGKPAPSAAAAKPK